MSSAKPIEVLYCCSASSRDEEMRQKLENHLKLLQWQGVITTWHKGMIGAGKEWESETYKQLMTADIILPLISSDFFASDYNWNVVLEMARQRHKAGTARVIPILLRPTIDNWKIEFGNIKALPEGERPVTEWRPYDKAFVNIAKGIRNAAEERTSPLFPTKSLQRIETTIIPVATAVANAISTTFSSLPKRSTSWQRKKLNLRPLVVVSLIVAVVIDITNYQLPRLQGLPSLLSVPRISAAQKVAPIGWVRIGVVSNSSGSLSAGKRLIQSSNRRLAPSVDSSVVPSIGSVVTVKTLVNLRKNRPKAYLPESVALLKPGEKIVILKIEPLIIADSNLPRTEVWAQVGRCNQACDR